MPRYLALLRGINVGGHRVKMDRLRALFEAMGMRHVSTFIASGNVVFEDPSEDAMALERRIEDHLEGELGYPPATLLRSMDEVREIATSTVFQPLDPDYSIHVIFCKEAPDEPTRRRVDDLRGPLDEMHHAGREIYWLCRGRLTESPVFDGLDKATGALSTTTRKITTIVRLVNKLGEAG